MTWKCFCKHDWIEMDRSTKEDTNWGYKYEIIRS